MPRELLSVIVVLVWLVLGGVALALYQRVRRRQRMLGRLYDEPAVAPVTVGDPVGLLGRWLYRAGFRSDRARGLFVLAAVGAVLLSSLLLVIVFVGDTLAGARRLTGILPGALGDMLYAVVSILPWMAALGLATLPWLIVRAARKRRIAEVEQDLPLVLELLATLGEAGLGLDAALDRILAAQPPDRVLTREFRLWQRDLLAGRGRVESLRRLAARVDVLSLSALVSALVQAEQVGSGVAAVLRRQADDLRDRRRERAVALATTLPVKLVFPLVICFLPGLFVATLGPAFYNFIVFADSVIQNRSAH